VGSGSASRQTSNKKRVLSSIKPFIYHTKLNFNNISNIYETKKKEPKRRKTRKTSIDPSHPTQYSDQEYIISLINKGDSNGEATSNIFRSRSVDPKSPDKLEKIPESATEKGFNLE
jgi:hypothetical protein